MLLTMGRSRAHRREVRKEARRWRPLVFFAMGAGLLCLAWQGDTHLDSHDGGRRLSSATSDCPQGQATALPYFLIVLYCFLGLAVVCDEPVSSDSLLRLRGDEPSLYHWPRSPACISLSGHYQMTTRAQVLRARAGKD